MKLFLVLLLFSALSTSGQESLISESYKLVNDINAKEKRSAIYMCRNADPEWKNFLNYKPVDEKGKIKFQRKLDTIKKYIGDDKQIWLKNIPNIKTWEGNVAAQEFVDCNASLDIDGFYKSHNETGVYFYSEPLFNGNQSKAIVYIWYISGRLGITALYYYCEKVDGIWIKKKALSGLRGFYS